MCADVVCTTPHASGEGSYQNLNKTIASATILDEAGAMSLADALLGVQAAASASWPETSKIARPW